MAKAGIVIGIIIVAVIAIAAAYYIYGSSASHAKAPTTVATTASTTAASTTINAMPVPVMTKFSSSTIMINPNKSSTVMVTAPDGVNITVMIPAGTYAMVGNNMLQSFNFTLATFNIMNLSSPSGYSNQTPAYGFAFEVNGSISPSISFVNATKAPVHLTTITHYPSTWYSWAYVGGTFNESAGTYTGGKYIAENAWTYNSITGTMTNTQFYKPIMWVFTVGPAQATAPAPSANTSAAASTTQPTTTVGGYSYP